MLLRLAPPTFPLDRPARSTGYLLVILFHFLSRRKRSVTTGLFCCSACDLGNQRCLMLRVTISTNESSATINTDFIPITCRENRGVPLCRKILRRSRTEVRVFLVIAGLWKYCGINVSRGCVNPCAVLGLLGGKCCLRFVTDFNEFIAGFRRVRA